MAAPDADFWKRERDAAVAHAITYGPRITDLELALDEGRKHVANLLSEWSPISGENIKRDAKTWLDATRRP